MPIAVLSAMAEEMQLYLDTCSVRTSIERAGFAFHRANYAGHDLVLVQCGVGKVHAAMCSQILVDAFQADAIVCTGTAGAAHSGLDIGDLVVADDCVHHDIDVTFLGLPRGQIPFTDLRFFETSPPLRDRAMEATLPEHTAHRGRVLTGDMFVQDADYLAQIRRDLDGDCVEMEGAAVGQVCARNDVPYLVVRAISDRADGTSADDFQAFLHQAAETSARVVLHLLDALDPAAVPDDL
jgi:adenosylhomocysteine nucleosidase